ncbi:small ribosomal subunit biogenesis GTPase RsgA [Pleionea litopenaei]|uniref:Small ribosomal subunit biogenesis GTPase RsgA n=1 Tax=Pleionea litopenaei TaxID=3070815 RepID=A0AA51RWL4_9GAMM|nr:small ribosomal subunit biogenesis GTPase RsgA [Pleionea sp. HL-JVS1]WMS88996.1 small ribosomal subunit biogenesis GTPase RsgA [Pleionea sp. HL-JVS1]
MAKRQKLTLQQKRRVAKSQRKKLQDIPVDDNDLGPGIEGIVVSRFGEQADVAEPSGQVHRVYLRQNLGSCVSGDRIIFRLGKDGGVIEAIEERRSELTRPTPHSGIKTIVANIDRIFIVVAPFPDYSSTILDRYLVACELAGIPTQIVFNKQDLITPEQHDFFTQQIQLYQSIGYTVHTVSAKSDLGVEELKQQMLGHESILVGQSGVGKSSLINKILPSSQIATGEVSENSRLGTHTTTASRVYFFDSGHIIDSPGVREFGLTHMEADQIIYGFRDLLPFAAECKFRNCRHLNEKGCAIAQAVETKAVSKQRLSNYQSIINSIATS